MLRMDNRPGEKVEIEKQGCDAGETERHKGGDYTAGEVASAPLGLA